MEIEIQNVRSKMGIAKATRKVIVDCELAFEVDGMRVSFEATMILI